MNNLHTKTGLILTEDEHDSIEIKGASIQVMPVWYWLLDQIK
jgi:predicted AAA+ superfamily ATPase